MKISSKFFTCIAVIFFSLASSCYAQIAFWNSEVFNNENIGIFEKGILIDNANLTNNGTITFNNYDEDAYIEANSVISNDMGKGYYVFRGDYSLNWILDNELVFNHLVFDHCESYFGIRLSLLLTLF